MTRTLVAAFLTAGLSAAALAQTEPEGRIGPGSMTCGQEAGAIWAIVEQSELQESQKNDVAQVLQQAQAQEQQGNTATCVQIVEQIKVALGLQQPQAGSPAPVPQ